MSEISIDFEHVHTGPADPIGPDPIAALIAAFADAVRKVGIAIARLAKAWAQPQVNEQAEHDPTPSRDPNAVRRTADVPSAHVCKEPAVRSRLAMSGGGGHRELPRLRRSS